jgi:hypothetical protein
MLTSKSGLGTVAFLYGPPVLLANAFVTAALAQGIPSPEPLPSGPSSADGGSGALIVVGVFIALLVIVGVIARLSDMRRRREEEGLALQARLGDALLTDPLLNGAAIVPTVRVPLWKGSPVRIEISGSVSNPEMRERALDVMRREATRAAQYAQDAEVEDRLSVLPPVAIRRAA